MSVASSEDLDDATLAARAVTEPELFTVLFRRHVADVHRFIRRRTGNDTLADDLTALTFEHCWSALPRFEPTRSSLRPWLFRIATHAVASHYRSEGRRQRREHLASVREVPMTVNESTSTDPPGELALLVAMSMLGERHQQVLSLRFLADLTTDEAAEAMQVSRNHFAVLQYRALTALRHSLGQLEGETT